MGFQSEKYFRSYTADTSELVIIKARAAGSSAFTLYYMFYALSDRASGKKLFVPRGLYGNLTFTKKVHTCREISSDPSIMYILISIDYNTISPKKQDEVKK